MNAGAYDMLVKPVDEATLLFAVHRAIEASRLLCQVKKEDEKLMAAVEGVMRDPDVLNGT
jgi:FixJ family two-component response regulator